MPSNQNAFAALTSLRDNKLTVLGVTVGKHTIEPGMHVPKAGTLEVLMRRSKPTSARGFFFTFIFLLI